MSNRIKVFQPEVFSLSQNWSEYLKKNGFVVLTDIITPHQQETALNMFKKDLSQISPQFNWEDPESWNSTNTPIVWGKSSAVFNGFAHCDTIWYLRTQSKAHQAFSQIYDTTELAVSFDGMSLFVSKKQKSPPWLHQDQKASDQRLSVQGILNLLPCGEQDAGFICVVGSHKSYQAPPSKTDWVMLPRDSEYYNQAVKLLTPERSLILFYSKLIHANTGTTKTSPGLNRLSAYITFVPKSRRSDSVYTQRVQGYFSGECCSHWADRYEPKKIPFYIRKKFQNNFSELAPTTINGEIPPERLKFF